MGQEATSMHRLGSIPSAPIRDLTVRLPRPLTERERIRARAGKEPRQTLVVRLAEFMRFVARSAPFRWTASTFSLLVLVATVAWVGFGGGFLFSQVRTDPQLKQIVRTAWIDGTETVTHGMAALGAKMLGMDAPFDARPKQGDWTSYPIRTYDYTVAVGDTINSIAKSTQAKRNVQCLPEWFRTYNPTLNPHLLAPGSVIKVPFRPWGGCDARGECIDH
jgi:hypothetical protein